YEDDKREWVRWFKDEFVSSDYQNHFNTKIGKCLILIERTLQQGKIGTTIVSLWDAYEKRTYASYHWSSRENKYYWEVPPITCELIPNSREKRSCTTREEFDAFV